MNCSVLGQDVGQLKTLCQSAVAKTALIGALHCPSTGGLRMTFPSPGESTQSDSWHWLSLDIEHRKEGTVPPETSTLATRAQCCPSSKRGRGAGAEAVHVPDAQRAQTISLGAAGGGQDRGKEAGRCSSGCGPGAVQSLSSHITPTSLLCGLPPGHLQEASVSPGGCLSHAHTSCRIELRHVLK